MNKSVKELLGYAAFLSALVALRMTEWSNGHPIGSYAESFIAAFSIFSSFVVAGFLGIRAAAHFEKDRTFYKFSAPLGWGVGILIVIVWLAIVYSIPGISDALGHLPESSS